MQEKAHITQRLPTRLASLCAALAAGLGLITVIGWISAVPWLTAFWPGGIPMAPSTALFFMLFGAATLLLLHLPRSSSILGISYKLVLMGTLLAVILMVVASFGIQPDAEHLGMHISGVVGGAPIGYMSPLTALCFVVVGSSLLLQAREGRTYFLSFGLAVVLVLVSLVLIIGYLVGAPLLYGTGVIPPALTTSLAFLMQGIALLLLAGLQIWPYDFLQDETSSQPTVVLIVLFLLLVTGILSVGYLYSRNLKEHFQKQIETELSAIADLKINELQRWRTERLRDASFFYKNKAFSDVVSRFFADPQAREARDQLQVWLQKFQRDSGYDKVFLADTQGIERFSVSQGKEHEEATREEEYLQVLRSRQITFLDFHRDPPEQELHLDVAVPLLNGPDFQKGSGLLIFLIDPRHYLYPLIRHWPIPSKTAESLLVRKDGNEVQFLNDLRFKEDAAFSMRFPLTQTDLPAVMAVQGKRGIVRGIDYRGVPVLAVIRKVPDSPWFLVAKIDLDEINQPLHERLVWITGLIGALLLVAGMVIAFIWRNQRIHFYRFRYMAAQAAEESEKRLMVIFENTKDGILVADSASKRFVIANRAICEMLGYGHNEMLTLGVQEIHPAENLPAIAEKFERQAKGEFSIAADVPIKRKDGSVFYADINTRAIEFGGKSCLLGTFRDITDRMQAENRIRHLNRVLRALRIINQLIIKADSADELIRNACNLLVDQGSYLGALIILTDQEGKPVSHATAGVSTEFSVLAEEMKQGGLPPCCEAADAVEGVCLIREGENICDTCKILTSCLSPQRMSARLRHRERVFGYLSVAVDQNIAMEAEEESLFAELAGDLGYSLHNMEMKKAVQKAEQETEKLEAQLIQAQKMEAVGQLAGGVAHDFNNLLTIILGYSQMMGEESGEAISSQEASAEIHEAAVRAKNLTRQLLAFSRKQILEMCIVDVNQVISDFEKLIRRTIGEDIKVEVSLAREPAWVRADVTQLEQILMNLAVNARDAMPDGGVLTIETARMDLDVSYAAGKFDAVPGRYVMLSVSDDGMGMDHETMERVFEPFYTTKSVGRGTGLGLSTVYGVVKQHGGNIWVYSEPGQGTTFKIYLPFMDETKLEEVSEPKVRQPAREGMSVLVVEDEPSLMKLACRVLERGGYRVYEAGDVDDAVDIARMSEEPIDLLLTDVIMPKMKGPEVYKKVSEYHPGIRVLYMSGYTENVIARQGIIKEGIHFLQKPFSAVSLLERVSETLGS